MMFLLVYVEINLQARFNISLLTGVTSFIVTILGIPFIENFPQQPEFWPVLVDQLFLWILINTVTFTVVTENVISIIKDIIYRLL